MKTPVCVLILALHSVAMAVGPFEKVPAKANARVSPLPASPDHVAAGKKLFDQHCAECHGPAAQGSKRAPGLTTGPAREATDGAIFWILTNGELRRGMPSWSKLPEPQRWQIVTYLKSLDAIQ
jgi:mono/diheme cytochrome c family protein